jgi:hypothetical protein
MRDNFLGHRHKSIAVSLVCSCIAFLNTSIWFKFFPGDCLVGEGKSCRGGMVDFENKKPLQAFRRGHHDRLRSRCDRLSRWRLARQPFLPGARFRGEILGRLQYQLGLTADACTAETLVPLQRKALGFATGTWTPEMARQLGLSF